MKTEQEGKPRNLTSANAIVIMGIIAYLGTWLYISIKTSYWDFTFLAILIPGLSGLVILNALKDKSIVVRASISAVTAIVISYLIIRAFF